MSLSLSHLYEFGNFRLDIKEKILMRGDEPIQITPKGFELLSVMVENHGRLLGKDELMDRIWADSFVEESNLTFNIRQLRKILGDDAHRPKYIKTVRQHGYRFIADVKQISKEDRLKFETVVPAETTATLEKIAPNAFQPAEISPIEQPSAPSKTKSFLAPIFVASLILLVGAVVIGSWYARNKSSEPNAPVLSAPFASEKLSTNGKVFNAVLSPDGRNVIYTNQTSDNKESVWIRQLEDGSNIEIIPPTEDVYRSVTLSPDGRLLYFTRAPRQTGESLGVYRVSIFGGIPQKIINDTQGAISLSPDGKQISFVRRPRRDEENYSLWIADAANGSNERKLAARPRPFRIADNRISPDGKSIAFAVGQSENASNEFGLSEVDLKSGAEREFSKERFFNIKNLAWLPDRSGLLMTASRVPNKNFRIWQVSAATGASEALTKDSETYSVLTLDKDATKIVATQIKQDFRLKLVNIENPSASQVLANAFSAALAPDGKIYFSSVMSGNDEIWSINPDGGSQRQLTNTTADESVPVVAPDGKTIFFVSNRTGAAYVWRMNQDGSNQTQITQKEGGFPISVSSDGEWVYYHHGIDRALWRVSLKSGEEQMVLNQAKSRFAVSPDGLRAAFSETQGDERVIIVVSLTDGQTVKTFHLADKKAVPMEIVWLPDGKSLAYITATPVFENNILWIQPLDEIVPRQIAALGDEELSGFALSVSPGGETFAVVQGEWLHDAVLLKGLR